MASSSKGKAKRLGPHFHDYLDGLREEFELQSSATSNNSRPRRFNMYIECLKSEFELMAEEMESLEKERDEYKVKGMSFILLSWNTVYLSCYRYSRQHHLRAVQQGNDERSSKCYRVSVNSYESYFQTSLAG